jgi:hypothetical protein
MPQSNAIFFALFLAFLIFITARGELPLYLGFLLASPKETATASNNGGRQQLAALAVKYGPEIAAAAA